VSFGWQGRVRGKERTKWEEGDERGSEVRGYVGTDGLSGRKSGDAGLLYVSTSGFPIFAEVWKGKRKAGYECALERQVESGVRRGAKRQASCTRCGRRCEGRDVAMCQYGGVKMPSKRERIAQRLRRRVFMMRHEWEWRKEKSERKGTAPA
jgi:hypothetical protein